MQVKNEIISECFTINNHGFFSVYFSTDQTLLGAYIQGAMLKPNYLARSTKISALFDIVSRGERLQDAAKLS